MKVTYIYATKPTRSTESPTQHNLHTTYIHTTQHGDVGDRRGCVLTVATEGASIGRHGAVAGEALPQLETHPLIVAGVLRTGGARSWGDWMENKVIVQHTTLTHIFLYVNVCEDIGK